MAADGTAPGPARASFPAVLRTALLAALLALPLPALADPALVPLPPQTAGVPWPTKAWPTGDPEPGVDRAALAASIDRLFAPRGRAGLPDTRAVLAIHRGRIVAARYAEAFGAGSRFLSWSMAKTVTQALVGILVRQGRLTVDQPTGVVAWQREGDPRRALTVRHLLHMTAGLDNGDGDGPGITFGMRLIFGDLSRDVVAAAADAPVIHAPDEHWEYSTGTSMLLADVVTRTVGGKDAFLAFVERELTGPLGITTLVPEFDASGNFLGGSAVWASAEDWARIGLLYLRGGTWDGRAIFADGWVDFSRMPAPAPNNGKYGAHLWLNRPPKGGQFAGIPGVGEDTFFLSGANGQWVAMVPDRDLLIVRLGEMHTVDWNELTSGIGAVAEAFPKPSRPTP
jgi:CubicO group peptidase (beta-lactamase class C family)